MPLTTDEHPAMKRTFKGKKAAPFRKGGKPRKPNTVHKPKRKSGARRP